MYLLDVDVMMISRDEYSFMWTANVSAVHMHACILGNFIMYVLCVFVGRCDNDSSAASRLNAGRWQARGLERGAARHRGVQL